MEVHMVIKILINFDRIFNLISINLHQTQVQLLAECPHMCLVPRVISKMVIIVVRCAIIRISIYCTSPH